MTAESRGIGLAAADWVAAHDVAAIGADNAGVEVMPFDRGVLVMVHIELLVKRGITFVEDATGRSRLSFGSEKMIPEHSTLRFDAS
jgi:hypothetical protein